MQELLGLPVLASEHGADVDKLIIYVHAVMVVLFVGWLGFFGYAIFRFRESRQPKADYHGVRGHFSNYLEVGIAIAEGVLLLGFAVPFWAKVVDKFPAEKDSLVIRVTAQQFNWNARYSGPDREFGKQDFRRVSAQNPLGIDPNDVKGKDDFPSEGQFTIPVNTNVIVHLTSKDVIHSFKVLPMRITQDCMPGMVIPVHFRPTLIGDYKITCAQLCGTGHYSMQGGLRVVSQEDYAKWVATKAKSAGAAESYE